MAGARRRLLAWLGRRPALQAWTLIAPAGLWLLLFFLVPILLMLGYSVMPRGTYGGVESGFTLEHYVRFFDPLYLTILGRDPDAGGLSFWASEATRVVGLGADVKEVFYAMAGLWPRRDPPPLPRMREG